MNHGQQVVEDIALNLLEFFPNFIAEEEIDFDGQTKLGRLFLGNNQVKGGIDYRMLGEIPLYIYAEKLDIGRWILIRKVKIFQ